MEYWKIEHNKPISIAIKGYMDKKSGKVTESRKEIERRFDGLDWRYQKQILFGFLQSGATDREWAYRKLFACWDECFIPTLQELWERYHEKTLSWLVIRFFPTNYVKEHLAEVSEGRNYFFIYERLAEDKDFNLDKTRLNETDLLSVKRKQQETITDDDFEDLFNDLFEFAEGEKMTSDDFKNIILDYIFGSQNNDARVKYENSFDFRASEASKTGYAWNDMRMNRNKQFIAFLENTLGVKYNKPAKIDGKTVRCVMNIKLNSDMKSMNNKEEDKIDDDFIDKLEI